MLSILFPSTYASCVGDYDWPQRPCYDTSPGPTIDQMKQEWQVYYQFKGKDWMEMKKVEMDSAIKDGTLKEWTEYGSSSDNFANWNVWYYYHLNGQAPDLQPYYTENATKDNFKLIISYYYVSSGGFIIIGIMASSIGITGFVIGRKMLPKNRTRK